MASNPQYDNAKMRKRPLNIELLLKISVAINVILIVGFMWGSISRKTTPLTQPVIAQATPPAGPKCTNATYLDLNVTLQQQYFQEQYYNQSNLIQGWLSPANALMAFGLMRAQTRACITGSVGEIGVHHGRHFIPLVLGALPYEPVLAVDLFDQQELNVDHSGKGNKTFLVKNMARYGIPEGRIHTIAGDTSQMKAADINKLKLPRFRFLSVDGGHSYDLTMSDMKLASAVIAPGGVIALDDVPNVGWIGVQEAMYDFLSLNRSIAPFLYSCQKMYFTTADYHDHYLKLAAQLPCGKCTYQLKYHPSRYTIRDWAMCVKLTGKAGKGGSDACMTCNFDEMPWKTLSLPAGVSGIQQL